MNKCLCCVVSWLLYFCWVQMMRIHCIVELGPIYGCTTRWQPRPKQIGVFLTAFSSLERCFLKKCVMCDAPFLTCPLRDSNKLDFQHQIVLEWCNIVEVPPRSMFFDYLAEKGLTKTRNGKRSVQETKAKLQH